MESKKKLLVLSGGPRAGKTVAACWAMRQIAKSSLFFNPSLLFQYGADLGYQQRAMTCGLLVIDDIGTENSDEVGKFMSRMDVLVCTRFDAGDRTVLTTNLPASEFAKRYGQRIAARIQAGGTFAAVGATQFVVDREPGEDDE
jgi:DNA replication protein DnaC